MNKQELIDEIKERLPIDKTDVRTEDLATTVLQAYADLRLPELEDRLEKYDSSQFKTFGKLDEMEKMQNL